MTNTMKDGFFLVYFPMRCCKLEKREWREKKIKAKEHVNLAHFHDCRDQHYNVLNVVGRTTCRGHVIKIQFGIYEL